MVWSFGRRSDHAPEFDDFRTDEPGSSNDAASEGAGGSRRADSTHAEERTKRRLSAGLAAVLLIAVGLPVLFIIGAVTKPSEVPLDAVAAYEGEYVTVEGVVIDLETTATGGRTITLHGDGTTVPVYIEVATKRVAINDRIRITAEARLYKSYLSLSAANDNTMEIVGEWDEAFILIGAAEEHLGAYATMEGTVTDIAPLGGGRALVTLRGAGAELTAFFERGYDASRAVSANSTHSAVDHAAEAEAKADDDSTTRFGIGDVVALTGAIEEYNGLPELIVYRPELVSVTARWNGTLPLRTVALAPWEYEYRPLTLEGFIENEPFAFLGSLWFTLVDDLDSPTAELHVTQLNASAVLDEGGWPVTPHKGDRVRVTGRFLYDADDCQFVLDCAPVETGSDLRPAGTVLEAYGDWYPSLDTLAAEPFAYERATLNLTGTIVTHTAHGTNHSFTLAPQGSGGGNMTLSIRCSSAIETGIELSGVAVGDLVRVRGVFAYNATRLGYELITEPPLGRLWRG